MLTDATNIWMLVALAAIAVVIALSVILAQRSRERTTVLRERFGPEYDRAVAQYGGRAEHVLAARAKRVGGIDFRELSSVDRARFASDWTRIQALFVDDPRAAVARANELIKELMRAWGYSPDAGFEQRAADLSVDHPEDVEHYRAAHALAQGGAGSALDTEQLRQAVVHYRVLFADLLQPERPAVSMLRPSHA